MKQVFAIGVLLHVSIGCSLQLEPDSSIPLQSPGVALLFESEMHGDTS